MVEKLMIPFFQDHQIGSFWLTGQVDLYVEKTGRSKLYFMTDLVSKNIFNRQVHRAGLIDECRKPDLPG